MKTLVISVETNGLNEVTRDVLKMGIVVLDGLLITKKIERWYYPKKYPYYIPEINGIDESVIKEKRAGADYAKHYEDDDTIVKEIEDAIGDEYFATCGINVAFQLHFAAQNEGFGKLLNKSSSKINLYKKDIKKYGIDTEDKAMASAQLSVIYTVRYKMLRDFRDGLFNMYASVLNVSIAEAFKQIEKKAAPVKIEVEIDDDEIPF